MSKKEKELQFITVNDEKIFEITDQLDLGSFKHNARLIKDFKDGRLQVEHSVFHGGTFLGNVKTIIYAYDDSGKGQFKAELETPKASKLIYDRNRQALQDSKNDFRGDKTRTSKAKPETKLSKQIAQNVDLLNLTPDQIEAFKRLGIDPASIIPTK
jgi:hypothetical protein